MNKTLKIAIKYALYYAPRPLQERLRKIQMERELREGMERAKRTRVSKAEFLELMDRLDWGSDIFLHTSMLNVGKIEGGAKFIADTLSRKVDTERYTLLVSALPYRGSFWEYLRMNPTFDVRTADIAMGAVNERFPGVLHGVRRSGGDEIVRVKWIGGGHDARRGRDGDGGVGDSWDGHGVRVSERAACECRDGVRGGTRESRAGRKKGPAAGAERRPFYRRKGGVRRAFPDQGHVSEGKTVGLSPGSIMMLFPGACRA